MNKVKKKIINLSILTIIFFILINVISYIAVTSFISPQKKFNKKIDKLDVTYIKKGTGSPILLIHDFDSSSAEFNTIINDISKKHTVIALDLPGFGESSKLDNLNYSINNLSNICNKFMLSLGYKNYSVIGHGFGANIALNLASNNNIYNSILLSPYLLMDKAKPLPTFIEGILKNNYFYSLYKYKENFFNASNLDFNIFEENLKVNSSTSATILNKIYTDNKTYNPVKNAKQTKAKILIISGTNTKNEITTYSFNLFKSYPNSSFTKIQNCNLNPHIESKSLVLKEVFSFIQ